MRELLSIVDSDLLLITPIPHLILSILTLLSYQALLASLLRIIGGVDSCSIVLNATKTFSISAGIRQSPGNIVVKDIKGLSPLRPRLLKLKVSNGNLLRIEKTHLNATAALSTYALIIRTKGIRSNVIRLIISLQNPIIRFLVF